MKRELTYKDVTYSMAVPATRLQILTWLITGGKYGKLFNSKPKEFREWASSEHINCRCSVVPIQKERCETDEFPEFDNIPKPQAVS